MRQQALLLIAAVTLCTSATGQHAHFAPTLSFAKSYDIADINKPVTHFLAHSNEENNVIQVRSSRTVSPRLDLVDLKHQLGNDIQHLRLEKRNQEWQGLFQGMMLNVRKTTPAGNKL